MKDKLKIAAAYMIVLVSRLAAVAVGLFALLFIVALAIVCLPQVDWWKALNDFLRCIGAAVVLIMFFALYQWAKGVLTNRP